MTPLLEQTRSRARALNLSLEVFALDFLLSLPVRRGFILRKSWGFSTSGPQNLQLGFGTGACRPEGPTDGSLETGAHRARQQGTLSEGDQGPISFTISFTWDGQGTREGDPFCRQS